MIMFLTKLFAISLLLGAAAAADTEEVVGAIPNKEVKLTITTDNYPDETSVLLEHVDGNEKYWDDEVFENKNTEYVLTQMIDPRVCHRFTIHDTYGDGICCSEGQGIYVLEYDGVVMLTGGAFGKTETYQIGEGCDNTDCSDITLRLKTDSYPQDNTVVLEYLSGFPEYWTDETFTNANTLYTLTQCVDKTKCLRFKIFDSYGDGLLGNAYYELECAGEVIRRNSKFGSGDETLVGDGCDGPTIPPCKEVTVTVKTDEFPFETKVLLEEVGGGLKFFETATFPAKHTEYAYTECVPANTCFRFDITDSYGDGICCNEGNGWFTVDYDGVEVFTGGDFDTIDSKMIGDCT